MWSSIINFLKAPVFPDDEEKSRRARAMASLYLNMGAAILILGSVGILFVFAEKLITTIILSAGFFVIVSGMYLNHRGRVQESAVLLLVALWVMTIVMTVLSGGIRSLDIIFFISGTVVAGILLGHKGAYYYAWLSLLPSLGMVFAERMGVVFPQLFSFPPAAVWIILFLNLVFTVIPLQVALQSLSDSALHARLSEEKYRLIASVMSDYAFSIQFDLDGNTIDQWLSGAFEAITGYSAEEYFARGGWRSILYPEDQAQDERDMTQLRANKMVSTEVRIVRKDSSIRWVRAYGQPLWDEKHNRLAGIYGAVQDITERKSIEISLHQRINEMALLNQVTLALTSEEDLYHALRALVKEIKHIMTLDAFHIGLYDQQTDIFSYSLFLNLDEDLQIPPRKLSENPGLTWEVISNGHMLYVPDITDPEAKRQHNILIVIDAGIRAYIGIPLMLHDRVIGIMSVQSCQADAYTPQQIRILETLAGQVAITVEKLNLLKRLQQELIERELLITELEKKNAEAETLRESTSIVAATLDTSETVQRILEQIKRVVQYDSTSAWLYEGEKAVRVGAINLPAEMQPNVEYIRTKDAPDYGFWSSADGATYILLENVQDDHPIFREPPLNYIQGWLGVSLRARGKLIGFIALDSRTAGKFTEHDAELARTFAEQVSVALDDARLFSDLQAELKERSRLISELEIKNAEAETLRESTAVIAATFDVSETVQRVLEQLNRIVQYDVASVWLYQNGKAILMGAHNMPPVVNPEGEYILSYDAPDHNFWANEALPYFLLDNVGDHYPIFRDPPLDYIKAWLGVSLRASGKLMGYIALDSRQPAKFNKHDAEMAVSFAEQVSIALEKARLFSELQEKFTERQKLVEELENKNAELERFTYTVSHDLRSPLVTIKGFLGYLEKDASVGNMENFRKDMARISGATDRMDNLLKDLLELSRVGRLVNKPKDIAFAELVKEAVEIVHGRLEARGITLQIQPNLPIVRVDQPRLIEVLQNLVDNAAKYMGDQTDPLIVIGATEIDVIGNRAFFVCDNGMGIAPEYHERIFGLFDKLDVSSEGTGIGLALVKRIIEFHGGRIWVESEVGRGSTFYFTLQG